MSGRKAEALKIIRELQGRSHERVCALVQHRTIYLGLGMKDEALQYLEKAYSEGSYYMIHLKVEPILDPVRADSRFTDIVRRVGHSQ